jgi:hypothetical protein
MLERNLAKFDVARSNRIVFSPININIVKISLILNMGDTNYFSGTVKLLNNPIQKLTKQKILTTQIWVELPQFRQNKKVLLTFWGNLGNEVKNFYQINDYIFIEGYTSIKKTNLKLTKIIITGLKVYPIFFTLKSIQKTN